MSQSLALQRPAADEYPSFYAPYIGSVPDGNICDILESDLEAFLHVLAATPAGRGTFRYAQDKWSVNDVLGHVIDAERIYTYRALRFARGDGTALPGFEQNDYVVAAGADGRGIADLADELAHVRGATVAFWRSLDPGVTMRRGLANGFELSVRAIAYVTAGHARHHAQQLRERYGVG